jgi:uncharacterized membrane protein
MKKMNIATVIAGALTAAAIGTAGVASAAPTTGSAADIAKALQDQGYSVQFNGTTNGPLSNCAVTGVHGLIVMMMPDGNLMMKMDTANPGTAYIDVSCPSSNN